MDKKTMVINDVSKIISLIEIDKGKVNLCLILRPVPGVDKWILIASAAWSDRLSNNSITNYWIKKLGDNLSEAQLQSIMGVQIIKTSEYLVQTINRDYKIISEPRFVKNLKLDNGKELNEVYIIRSIGQSTSKRSIHANRNPLYNAEINPNYNSTLNPNYNSVLNPNYNSLINPTYNSLINPTYNSLINPVYNSSINPQYNSLINPTYNSSLNPQINTKISPNTNIYFDGLIEYDKDLNKKSFLITANEDVILFFNFSNIQIGYGVKSENGFVIFDNSNIWISYLIKIDFENVYLKFNLNNQWIGILV